MTLIAGCAAAVISAAPALAAQTPKQTQHAADKAKLASGMTAKCQAMMTEREKMMTDVKAADQRLDELVAKMNAAPSADKAAATAIVVTEMVTQRRMMHDGMMKMQHSTMEHMMEHMQAGKESIALCPMMKPTGDIKH